MVFYYAALSFYCFISIFILKNLIVLVKKYHKNDHNYLIILKKCCFFAIGNLMSMLWHSSDENPSIAGAYFFCEQLRLPCLAGNNNF